MVEFFYVRTWEKRNLNQLLLKHFVTQRLDIVQKSLWMSYHFGIENYAWRLDIVKKSLVYEFHNFSYLIFWNKVCQKMSHKKLYMKTYYISKF